MISCLDCIRKFHIHAKNLKHVSYSLRLFSFSAQCIFTVYDCCCLMKKKRSQNDSSVSLGSSPVQPPTWSRTVTKSALAFSSQLVEISKGRLSTTSPVAVSGLHYSLGETTFSSIQSWPPYQLTVATIPSLTVCPCQEEFGSVTFITPFKWL